MKKERQKKKRVLLFIKTPPPFHGASIMNLYAKESKYLRSLFTIRVIDSHYSKNVEHIGKFSIWKITKILLNIFKLSFELLFYRPKVVFFQLSHGRAIIRETIFLIIIKLFRIKILYMLHGKGIDNTVLKSRYKYRLFRFLFKNSNLICLSNILIQDVKRVYKGNPFILPNAIRLASNIKRNVINSDEKIKLIFLSNLIESKGLLDYIEAVKILKSRTDLFSAIIVGGEAEFSKEDIEKIIISNDLSDTLYYLGPKYGDEKYQILADSDILVFPTYNDTFGIVLIEAMQFGLNVITCAEGGIPDVVKHEENGFIVEKHSPQLIADLIVKLIHSPEMRKKIGDNARKSFHENYKLEIYEERLGNIIREVINA